MFNKKDMMFLSKEGITDTKATRVADFAKLKYTSIEDEIKTTSFIDTYLSLIEGTNTKCSTIGLTDDETRAIFGKVEEIGKLKALCAWLREAVNAHQRIINASNSIPMSKYAEIKGIEIPVCPEKDIALTENDVIAEKFDIRKLCRYFSLEATASAFSQAVAKGNPIDSARHEFYDKKAKKISAKIDGANTVLTEYKPSVNESTVEELFYKLQQAHGDTQSTLNSIKSEIKNEITLHEIESGKEYTEKYTKWMAEHGKVVSEYTTWLAEVQKDAFNLKIVIPNDLKEIYEEVCKLGKVK